MQGRSLMNDIQMAFAKEVYLYNEKALISTQQKPDLMDSFMNVARKLNDKNIEDAWTMLSYMASVSIKTSADSTDRVAVHMQQAFVHQAIKYLEMTFKEFLKNSINSNLEQAKIGGKLGTLQLITGYLRLNPSKYYSSFEETFTDNQQPLWAIIYLCLRCGDYEAARSVASKAKKDDIAGYLGEFMQNNGCLSVGSENKLKLEYKGRIKRSQDSFKRAVYRYLSRLDIDDDLSDILDNVDDFLWFNLNSIQFNVNATDGQQQDHVHTPTQYQEFQHKMSIDYGETYFTKSRNPYPYLQVLLLTSQFELAIEFLLKYEHMVVHALHMAIALYEKRLLNLTKPSVAQLVCSDQQDAKGVKRINFASLIKMYTRKFECTDPRDALEYYYFVRNIFNAQNKNYFALYISELALETREFELLFGKLEKNGVRKSGALDKFLPKTDDIINVVAKEIENKGLIEESIKLYDLCKQQQRVLELCNKLISQFVCDVNTVNSNRDRLKQMVRGFGN
jgi:nuclear pore complex protein Nup93